MALTASQLEKFLCCLMMRVSVQGEKMGIKRLLDGFAKASGGLEIRPRRRSSVGREKEGTGLGS